MSFTKKAVGEIAFVVPLNTLRETPCVHFHYFPPELVGEISAVDRVEHGVGAHSPTAKDNPEIEAWYMHPHQEDNILVLKGERIIQLFKVGHAEIETFEVTPDYIKHKGEVVHEGPAVLCWGTHVFHRVESPNGSLSINYAKRHEGFNIKDNFNIYELDTETGNYSVLREGHLDQPPQNTK